MLTMLSVISFYLIIQVCFILEHLFGSLDIEQDIGECSDGILITTHHHVGETYIVISADLTGWYA